MPDRPHVLSLVMKKLFLVAAPATLVTLCLIAALVETRVRLTWDPMKGHPGFYVPDPERFERLALDYEGWFAGVPVHINKLGFRDTREYSLEKNPRTFRIVVLAEDERVMLENLAGQEALLSRPVEVADRKEQQLTNPKPLPEGANRPQCTVAPLASFSRSRQENAPGFDLWKKTAARFQQLSREGQYRIVFFVNAAPVICQTEDLFVGDDTKLLDDFFLEILSAGTAAVSSHDGFLRYRPSDMPGAGAHSLGNANVVKAQVLFDFLKDRILPPLLAKRTT